MFRKHYKKLLVACAATFLFACDSDDLLRTPAVLMELFGADLTPAQEVPPVTNATSAGTSTITVVDTNNIRIETVITSAIDSVTQAHVHAGAAGANGGIMIWLTGQFSSTQLVARGFGNATSGFQTTGLTGGLHNLIVTRGVNPTCPAAPALASTGCFVSPFTFDSLLFRVRNGSAYVNVHTRRNPGGEIRGQVQPQ